MLQRSSLDLQRKQKEGGMLDVSADLARSSKRGGEARAPDTILVCGES